MKATTPTCVEGSSVNALGTTHQRGPAHRPSRQAGNTGSPNGVRSDAAKPGPAEIRGGWREPRGTRWGLDRRRRSDAIASSSHSQSATHPHHPKRMGKGLCPRTGTSCEMCNKFEFTITCPCCAGNLEVVNNAHPSHGENVAVVACRPCRREFCVTVRLHVEQGRRTARQLPGEWGRFERHARYGMVS